MKKRIIGIPVCFIFIISFTFSAALGIQNSISEKIINHFSNTVKYIYIKNMYYLREGKQYNIEHAWRWRERKGIRKGIQDMEVNVTYSEVRPEKARAKGKGEGIRDIGGCWTPTFCPCSGDTILNIICLKSYYY